jgi:hypothetical protein
MTRKLAVFSLALLLMVGGLISVASAAQNVANTTQKGSLLIFPRIDVLAYNPNDPEPGFQDTIISIGNDYYKDVWVKCYWVDSNQEIQDFMFALTPNQVIWFSAQVGTGSAGATVPPFAGREGELKCWAVDPSGRQQISFNHLYGTARIYYSITLLAEIEYNAWSFTARGVALGDPVGPTPGQLDLTGAANGYDACPQYLVDNFPTANAQQNLRLTLVPCKQDLRQDRIPTCTKAKFDVWNENETKFTGSYRCLKCWYEGYLNQIGADGIGYGSANFTMAGLGGNLYGRYRVQGVASTVCTGKIKGCTGVTQVASPFLGVQVREKTRVGTPFIFMAGGPTFGAGADGSGWIKWDPNFDVPQAPEQ